MGRLDMPPKEVNAQEASRGRRGGGTGPCMIWTIARRIMDWIR